MDAWNVVAADRFLRELPPEPEWIVEPLLMHDTEMHFFGREGIGKSRLMYQFAHAVQEGGRWLTFEARQTGPVLYLQLDMAPHEMGRLLVDAKAVGMDGKEIYVPSERMVLDVLHDRRSRKGLAALNEELKPLVVIVDTANDSFDVPTTTNEVVRRVLRSFRSFFPDSGRVYVNHERKHQEGSLITANDEAYLGPGIWARKAHSSVQLVGINQQAASLHVHKARLGHGKQDWKLRRAERGFFELDLEEWDPKLALRLWPECLSNPGEAKGCQSMADVCKSIAQEFGHPWRTVYQASKRARRRGERYSWWDEERTEVVGCQ